MPANLDEFNKQHCHRASLFEKSKEEKDTVGMFSCRDAHRLDMRDVKLFLVASCGAQ